MADRRAEEEVEAFEYNAKAGVHQVAFWWLFRKAILPLGFFFCIVIVTAWTENGTGAAVVSAAVFGGLIVLLWMFSSNQFQKIWAYWSGK